MQVRLHIDEGQSHRNMLRLIYVAKFMLLVLYIDTQEYFDTPECGKRPYCMCV